MKYKFMTVVAAVLMSLSLQAQQPDPNFFIYLCFGQSNMEAGATPADQDKDWNDPRFQFVSAVDMPRYNRVKGEWYTATPPICRQSNNMGPVDFFGRKMIEELPSQYRVGVINVSVAGAKLELWDKDACEEYLAMEAADQSRAWLVNMAKEYDMNCYQRIVDMAKIAQESGVIKGILLHQGESNNTQQDWPQKVKLIYDRLLNDLNLNAEETPLFVGEMVSKQEGGACWGHNAVIAKVPSVIPNSYVISSANCPQKGDGLHFTAQGYRIMGQRYAKAALELMGIDAEIEEPAAPATEFELDSKFTSLSSIGSTPFVIYNEATKMAFFGSDNQNLGYDALSSALQKSNATIGFKLEASGNYYLLRAITPNDDEYNIWGGARALL